MWRRHVVIAGYAGTGKLLHSLLDSRASSVRWFYYRHCDPSDACNHTSQLRRCADMANCEVRVLRPNTGRESRVYLHHIIRFYARLPDEMFFFQENEYAALSPFRRAPVEGIHYPRRGMWCRGGPDCGGNACWRGQSLAHATRAVLAVRNCSCPSRTFRCHARGTFAVSRAAVRVNNVDVYMRLLQLTLDTRQHRIPNGCASRMEFGVYVGHALERTWPYVFGTCPA